MRSRATAADRGAHSILLPEVLAHPSRFSHVTPLRIRNTPMLLLAACFATGILCRHWWQPPAQMILVCCALLCLACIARTRAPRLAWFTTGTLWIALGWTAAVLQPNVQDTSLLRYADELQRTMEARVVAVRHLPPRPLRSDLPTTDAHTEEESQRDATQQATEVLEVQALAIEDVSPDLSRMTPIHGGAILTLLPREGHATIDIPCGATIRTTVRLHAPHRYVDPGVWSYADALTARGITTESSIDPSTLHILNRTKVPASCYFAAAQRWSSTRLSQLAQSPALAHLPRAMRLTATDTGMLAAMLFGDRTFLQRSVRTAFERTGSFHLFVVAGMHVTLLLAGLFALLQRMRVPRWLAAFIAITTATLYACLTGFGQPVQRALLMSSVYLLVRLMGRQRNALNALGAAIFAMLALRPDALAEAGFQMTVLAIIAIAGIAIPIGERTIVPLARALRNIALVRDDPHIQPRLAQMRVTFRWIGRSIAPRGLPRTRTTWLQRMPSTLVRGILTLCELLLITLIAEIVMALPMALYFHRVTPFAAPANLFALPMVGVLMFCAIATFLASLLHPIVAVMPAAVTALLLHTVAFIIGTLSSLHGADIRTPAPTISLSLLAFFLWCGAVYLLHRAAPIAGRAALALLPFGLLLVLYPRAASLHRDRLEFTAIDVGQGDSLLVVSPTAGTMLIDAGGPNGSAAPTDENAFNIGEEVVSPYLWSRGLRHLDTLVLTHAHSDHIGGMLAVLRNFQPHELWLSVDADSPALQALLREAARRKITVRHLHAGDTDNWGGTRLQILSPSATYAPKKTPTNDDSLVLRIDYGKASILSEGDAEHPSETAMVAARLSPVTLLKIGHHGSNTSTSAEIIAALHPTAAIISCGLGNRFGHPRMPVLQRLQAAGVHTARTDDMGAVQYLLSADGSIATHVLASNP
ncbi:ComEC/Rec2-related protein [Terriglobus roseus DSM 18391]|uniref:ComEC/Rec2-related protein n=1 Tax=Terriglobus roseus (strain DSM 18391 / NRRL B-41598 / KBS 63) TaxID=926566 RepID=I3ZDL4_TERRK|nr:ComEC/Rec2 family competence protein [Terriglobus roseus]AFL87332.1 ComEC/Rec2-related protein [Terriglobus roseus DSM 18391]